MRKENKERKPQRRQFLESLGLGALALFSVPPSILRIQSEETRQKKDEMFYRRLGRTNLMVSEISLGGSPLPSWPLFLQIIERGVNYVDTSSSYNNGNSERQIGRLFKEIGRDKVYVATKFHLRGNWNEESIIQSVEGSLLRLQTDYIDVLMIHGASPAEDLDDDRLLNAFETLKKEGKYRYKGLSCHSNHHRVIQKAVDCGHYDMVQLGYNVFDIEEAETEVQTYGDYLEESGVSGLIKLAAAKDIGVIAMKTLKVGGRRQNLEKYKTGKTSLFQAMLKWVLENRNVSSVVTEMLTYEQMEEDLACAGASLAPEERRMLFHYVAGNSKDYCHMCGRCQASCPAQIPTADILRFLAYWQSYGKIQPARESYAQLKRESPPSPCLSCGTCERVCPYGVSARNNLREAERLLSG